MPHYDLPIEQLRAHRCATEPPTDLAEFWAKELAALAAQPLEVRFTPVDTGFVAVQTADVEFRGADGDQVRGWLHLPSPALRGAAPLPAVVQYQGYDGGRGLAQQDVFWAVAGYAQLVMDNRGQGSGWSVGDTADPAGSGPAQLGYLTKGVAARETYYYRRLYLDAVRAVEAVRAHPAVDGARVAVCGGSQGGGLAVVAAALDPSVVAALVDVPFLADIRRAVEVAQRGPYPELVRYLGAHRDLAAQTWATLGYFDVALLAARASAPALFSVALMDETCPPSAVYSAYNAYAGPKEITEYPYNDHEGGDIFQKVAQLRWLRDRLP
jgi:cephalosporin-C deacetylase